VLALIRNNFQAFYCHDRFEALAEIQDEISPGSTVGASGSITMTELGLLQSLFLMKGCRILDHNCPGLTDPQKDNVRRSRLTCDLFLTSANAITLDGQLVNMDGIGNRIAPMLFGPQKVFVVAGVNKIVKNVEDGIRRIKQIAAPMNNRRRMRSNPCTQTGECIDCCSTERICNVTCILHKKPLLSDIHVFIVGEKLGFWRKFPPGLIRSLVKYVDRAIAPSVACNILLLIMIKGIYP